MSNLGAVQAVLATGEAGMMSCMAEDGTLDSPTTIHGFYWERPAAK